MQSQCFLHAATAAAGRSPAAHGKPKACCALRAVRAPCSRAKNMKKIGLFGGSFDPIHNAHIKCALIMKGALKLDKLIVMPAKKPPHKEKKLTDSEHRFNMCRLAFEDYDDIEVSRMELDREGISYTYETISELKKAHPGDKLYMFAGGDMFASLGTWKNIDYILKNAAVCTIPRDELDVKRLILAKKQLEEYSPELIILDIEPMNVSSTQIRQRVSRFEDISDMVPKSVREYIEHNGLYRS